MMEKVLITQEERARCLQCVRLQDNKGFQAKISISNKGLSSGSSHVSVYLKYSHAEDRQKVFSNRVPYLTARLPYFKAEINAVILFRALGITSDKDLMDIICLDVHDMHMIELIIPSLEAANADMVPLLWDNAEGEQDKTSESIRSAALEIVGNKLRSNSANPEELPSKTLERCLFPDLVDNDLRKAMFLGHMVGQVMACSLGRRREDNKDSLVNKRLELVGDLFLSEMKRHMSMLRKELQKSLQKVLVKDGSIDLQKLIDTSKLSDGFERAFSTGNWALPPEKRALKTGGLVVPLDRKNPMATLSHLHQIELQVNPRAKLWETRYPNKSHIGRFCLVQSPDGEKCGLWSKVWLFSAMSLWAHQKRL